MRAIAVFVLVLAGACKSKESSTEKTKPPDDVADPGSGGENPPPEGGDEAPRKTTPEAAAYLERLVAYLDAMCKCPDEPCIEETGKTFDEQPPSTTEFSEADEKVLDDLADRQFGCVFRIKDPKRAEEYTTRRIAAEEKRAKLIPTLDAPYTLEDESARPQFDGLLAEVKKACACTTPECADGIMKQGEAPAVPKVKSERDASRYMDMIVWLSVCVEPVFAAQLEKKFNRR
jgi:hypothetical protein